MLRLGGRAIGTWRRWRGGTQGTGTGQFSYDWVTIDRAEITTTSG